MADLVTSLKVEIDAGEIDRAIERYALVSRVDVKRMIAEYDKALHARLKSIESRLA